MKPRLLPIWPSLDGTFIVSDENRAAYKALHSVWPDNKIIIYGSWGKSHLAQQLYSIGYHNCNPNNTPHLLTVWDNFDQYEYTPEKAFHHWNECTRMQYKLCITMRHSPSCATIEPHDLQSRIRSTFAVQIKPPGDLLRRKIFCQWLYNGGIRIEQQVLDYFFSRYDSDLPTLSKYARKLHEFAMTRNRKLTIICIRDAMEI